MSLDKTQAMHRRAQKAEGKLQRVDQILEAIEEHLKGTPNLKWSKWCNWIVAARRYARTGPGLGRNYLSWEIWQWEKTKQEIEIHKLKKRIAELEAANGK
jgi:hypothetical protein